MHLRLEYLNDDAHEFYELSLDLSLELLLSLFEDVSVP